MLALTRKTHYALIALAYLADRPGQCCSARRIAEEYLVPLPVLMNILKTLNRHGLVASTRGSKGGYRMAIDPNRMSLAELINVVEGPIRFVQCLDRKGREANCSLFEACPIRGPVMRLHVKLNQFLEAATLAEVIGGAPTDAPTGN